jgi:bifunctional polynucleotide phosphatase/kinase
VQKAEKGGHKIVIFSNQGTIKTAHTGKAAKNFQAKVDRVLEEAGVKATVLVSTIKDDPSRKPGTGMWEHFTTECNGGVQVDLKESYYVGDAAGRPQDFSDTDKQFAEAIGLPFKTPEEFFGESARSALLWLCSQSQLAYLHVHMQEPCACATSAPQPCLAHRYPSGGLAC